MYENVTIAELYGAYLDCRSKKRNTEPCALFELDEAIELSILYEQLNSGTYEIDTSDAFCVTSLAGFLVHTHSYNIRCRAWFLVDEETKTYLEQPPWSFKKIRVLPQYTKQYKTIQLCTKSKCLKRTG